MALGNPFLATYSADQVVRTYEYVLGTFVPLGVSPAYAHNPSVPATSTGNNDPVLQWLNEDDFLLVEYANTVNQNTAVALDKLADVINTTALLSETNVGGIRPVYLPDLKAVVNRYSVALSTGSVKINGNAVRLSNVGVVQSSGNSLDLNLSVFHTDVAVSRDNAFLFLSGVTGSAKVYKRTSAIGTWPPTFDAGTNIPLSFDPEMLRIMGDGATVLAFSRNENVSQIWKMEYNSGTGNFTWTKTADMLKPIGSPHKAEVSPDGIYVAVSYVNGSDYTTRVYRRASGLLVTVGDIASFGRDLTWSVDGALLVDATYSKARELVAGSLINRDDAMVNVLSGVTNAKLSMAPFVKSATPFVYIAAVEAFGDRSVDLDNIKMTLLTSSAVYDEEDDDIDDVTDSGVNEVSGGGWPVGGILLTGVAEAMGSTDYQFSSDPVEFVTFGSTLSWRYAVIYDATSGKPLVFYDYFGNRSVEENRNVTFNYPNGVFIRLTR